MSTKLIFVCDLGKASSINHTIYGMWLSPICIVFDKPPLTNTDKRICECCAKGITKSINKQGI